MREILKLAFAFAFVDLLIMIGGGIVYKKHMNQRHNIIFTDVRVSLWSKFTLYFLSFVQNTITV